MPRARRKNAFCIFRCRVNQDIEILRRARLRVAANRVSPDNKELDFAPMEDLDQIALSETRSEGSHGLVRVIRRPTEWGSSGFFVQLVACLREFLVAVLLFDVIGHALNVAPLDRG